MPLSQLRNVNFGRTRLNATGSTGVGYQLLDETGGVESSRTTTGVYQTAPGIYAAYITFPDDFRGQILWDTGTAFATTYYATEAYNVEENDPKVSGIYTQTTYISGTVAGLSSSVTTVQNTLNVVSGNIDVIGTQTSYTSGTVGLVFNTLQQVSGNVDNVYQIVTSTQTQITQMSGTLNAVYDLVFDLSGTINILSSSVDIISSSAAILSGAAAGLSQLSGTLGSIEAKVDRLIDIQYGRWLINNNQMIFYKEDNATEVARFDLFDENGNPSMDAVFDRVKV